MALRDQLERDLSVFLDLEGFGESVTFDGVAAVAVRDEDLALERSRGMDRGDGEWDGTSDAAWSQRTVLHVRSEDVARPVEGQPVTVDGLRWYVRRVSEAEGILEITLERQEA